MDYRIRQKNPNPAHTHNKIRIRVESYTMIFVLQAKFSATSSVQWAHVWKLWKKFAGQFLEKWYRYLVLRHMEKWLHCVLCGVVFIGLLCSVRSACACAATCPVPTRRPGFRAALGALCKSSGIFPPPLSHPIRVQDCYLWKYCRHPYHKYASYHSRLFLRSYSNLSLNCFCIKCDINCIKYLSSLQKIFIWIFHYVPFTDWMSLRDFDIEWRSGALNFFHSHST
jgi:hypothetical protein